MADRNPLRPFPLCAALACAALVATAGLARAEAPMNVDDAGTVGLGGIEVEFGYSKDDETRGFEAGVGYGLTDELQVGLALGRAKDRAPSPDADFTGVGLSFKWVPIDNGAGLTAGLAVDFGHETADDNAGTEESADSQGITALASYAFASGLNAHVNLSRAWSEGANENAWGLGADYGITEQLAVTAEVFGSQHGAPDRALGLRYEIKEGVKVSGAIGRGNDRSFGVLALLLEF